MSVRVEAAPFAFGAEAEGTDVALTWQTASETNNAGFHLDRAVDAGPFVDIGFVEGAGTTTEPQSYRFTVDRDLAPGEGRVVQTDAGPVAVHRDETGAYEAVSAVCSHMGALVEWNEAEASWDCPCHGSRFDADGTVRRLTADRYRQETDAVAPWVATYDRYGERDGMLVPTEAEVGWDGADGVVPYWRGTLESVDYGTA